jgi:hypothetical protein
MTNGKTSDIKIAEKLAFPKGSILAIDRGYIDFNFLLDLDSTGVFFVIRAKTILIMTLLSCWHYRMNLKT